MEGIYRLETKDRPGLLFAMMQVLAGDESRISFEGKLSHTELVKFDGVSEEEDSVLKRGTLWPKLDFLILSMTTENLPIITKAIRSKIAFGDRGIIHVQIARHGKMAFAAYDCFHRDCVVAYSGVSIELLDQLTHERVIHGYKRAPGTPS